MKTIDELLELINDMCRKHNRHVEVTIQSDGSGVVRIWLNDKAIYQFHDIKDVKKVQPKAKYKGLTSLEK